VPDALGGDVKRVGIQMGDVAGHCRFSGRSGSGGRAENLPISYICTSDHLIVQPRETFRFVPLGGHMPSVPSPRAAAERCAAALLRELLALPGPGPIRVTDVAGGLACLVLVWPVDARMPSAGGPASRAAGSGAGRTCCGRSGRRGGRSPARR
jgi:hypothetical protein